MAVVYDAYGMAGELTIAANSPEEDSRQIAGDPLSRSRAAMRRRCKPKGPFGLLLESIYLQAAVVTPELTIQRQGHPAANIVDTELRMLDWIARDIAVKNRTRYACGTRQEAIDLPEIDKMATNQAAAEWSEKERSRLKVVQTGSSWTAEAGYWAGQYDSKKCALCGLEDETFDHFWRCPALADGRKEADQLLAEVDPDLLPAPMRIGIAPAMHWDITKSFWKTRDVE